MSAIGKQITNLETENQKLRVLISDLTYSGIDRGYSRGSQMWRDAVISSAEACGLSDTEITALIGSDDIAD